MKNLSYLLENREINYSKLIDYGFKNENDIYVLNTKIYNNQFEIIVKISKKENISKLIDLMSNEEYVLVDIQSSTGEFVGKVKEEYENKLQDIINKCTDVNVFKNKQSREIIEYIRKKYDDKLEFLWEKLPEAAIWRNKKNSKWYGIIMKIPENKLYGNSDKMVDVIDLRYQKGEVDRIIDMKKIFPGYHMNKKSWISIKLDESMDLEEILEYIDNSYKLSIPHSNKSREEKVFELLRTIPIGKVVTYGQIAEYLGNKGLARVIGNILHNNPDGEKNPCYKVVNAKGELAEAFVFGGINVQKEKLEKEGIEVIDNKVDLEKYQYKF